jgi:hypothetical protein
MRGEGKSAWRTWFLPIFCVLAVVALICVWALGRPSSSVKAPSPSANTVRTRAGVPVGFPDSRKGAAEAVAAYQRAFASPAILRPGVLKARIEAVATPGYAETMLAANTPGTERIAAGAIGEGLSQGLQTLFAAVPIGYRIEAYTPDRARILTWGFTLLGNASTVEPAAYFGLTHTELRWAEGQWQIAESHGGFGPTPKLATRPGPLAGYDVIDVAKQLRSYELAP